MVKLFIDVCALGPKAIPAIEAIARLHPLEIKIAHLTKYFAANTPDDVWIPKLADENWTLITSDRGRHSRVGEKLPEICLEYHVTHILMSKSLNQLSTHHRTTAIIQNLDGIIEADSAERGSRFHLRKCQGNAIAKLVKVDVQIPQQKTIQKNLIEDDAES